MKLELKHLAPYLPYGLKMELLNFPIGRHFRTLELDCGHDFNLYLQNNWVRPILRPLSDLTKEIEVNGEKFVPTLEYSYLRFEEISNYEGGENAMNFIQVREQNILLKLHFDIFGLIPQGLAIDINTLEK